MAKRLGVAVPVVNRPGGGGAVALGRLASGTRCPQRSGPAAGFRHSGVARRAIQTQPRLGQGQLGKPNLGPGAGHCNYGRAAQRNRPCPASAPSPRSDPDDDEIDPAEAQRRMDEAVKRMLSTPPRPRRDGQAAPGRNRKKAKQQIIEVSGTAVGHGPLSECAHTFPSVRVPAWRIRRVTSSSLEGVSLNRRGALWGAATSKRAKKYSK